MSKSNPLVPREAIEREKARLLREAAAKAAEAAKATADAAALDDDLKELDRLATLAEKYNLALTPKIARPEVERSVPVADGEMTLADLIEKYRESEQSSYKKLRFKTREHYDTVIKGIIESAGTLKLAGLEKKDILNLYDRWTDGGKSKLAMAHARIAMLRIVANYCDEVLHDPVANRFSIALHRIRIPRVKPRTENFTEEHAKLIIAKAHEIGRSSIALAQAFQFDLGLRQKDVIGEWVPMDEITPPTEVHANGLKWVRGVRWEEIGDDMVLRHNASFDNRMIEANLNNAPLVMLEIERYRDKGKARGPIIICEGTGAPWIPGEYRRWWRKIARACGIPDNVKSMDSRSSSRSDGDVAGNAKASEV